MYINILLSASLYPNELIQMILSCHMVYFHIDVFNFTIATAPVLTALKIIDDDF